MERVIVIGGGAAGMMAALKAARDGCQVSLFEKNEKLGKKLYITGKGRCNVTNACDVEALFEAMVTNRTFMYSSFYTFSNERMMEFLEQEGCPLKTERGHRVFPASDRSVDVIRALEHALKKAGVRIIFSANVGKILTKGNQAAGIQLSDGREFPAEKVIVATGGKSYPSTGSTGDGYGFAKKAGHRIVEPRPALVSMRFVEDWVKKLEGLSLIHVEVSMEAKSREFFRQFGELVFTNNGASGPVILSASSYYGPHKGEKVTLYIDLKPALSEKQLDARVLRDFAKTSNKEFKNALGELLPKKMIPVIIHLSGISPGKKVHDITKTERQQLVHVLKHVPFTVIDTGGFREAVITQGGIDVKEINPGTMESKKMKRLFFAGEVLDLDAVTGGYNLQIAWSTGYLAGTKQEDENDV